MSHDPDPTRDSVPARPLPLLRQAATERRVVIVPTPDRDRLVDAAASLGLPAIADAHDVARRLIDALRPADLVRTDGDGGDAADLYRVRLLGRTWLLRLTTFCFPGQPQLVLGWLLPDADAAR
jgi:hypothetical protein